MPARKGSGAISAHSDSARESDLAGREIVSIPNKSSAKIQELADLAGRIRDAHGSAFQHALEAGNCLLKAKCLVNRGEWLPWIRDHCQISVRTAQTYMRLANEVGHLIAPYEGDDEDADEPNTQRVAYLSVRRAIKTIARPRLSRPAAADSMVEPSMMVVEWETITDVEVSAAQDEPGVPFDAEEAAIRKRLAANPIIVAWDGASLEDRAEFVHALVFVCSDSLQTAIDRRKRIQAAGGGAQ
jgi:hypothetical protein